MRSLRRAVLGVVLTVALTACGAQDDSGDGDGRPSGTLTVFAAASLTDFFTELGDRLMAENPDLQVRFTFAGSSALAAQIVQGAPADLFASANPQQMAVVTA